MLKLQVHQLPLKLSATSHQILGLLQSWSTCRNNLLILFYSLFVKISTNFVTTMPSCTILFPNPWGYYNKHGELHFYPLVFTPKHMGGPFSSELSISHSSTLPTYRQISCRDFQNLFLREFILGFLSQLPHFLTKWMGVLMFCFVVGSYLVCRDPVLKSPVDKTLIF